MDKVDGGLLLQDPKQYYAILNRPNEQKPDIQGPSANVMMLRTAPVNGTVYAFDRQTGKYNWFLPVTNQMILLERFQELPMLFFTARFNKPIRNETYVTPVVATLSINKRTGKRLRDSEVPNYPPHSHGPFYALAVDRHAGTFDLIAQNLKVAPLLRGLGHQERFGQREPGAKRRRKYSAGPGKRPLRGRSAEAVPAAAAAAITRTAVRECDSAVAPQIAAGQFVMINGVGRRKE